MKGDDRFWSQVEKSGECWMWVSGPRGGCTGRYGRVYRNGRMESAHRRSYEIARGPIPQGMSVLHHCDNPRCVRPDHLFLGTQADNMADMKAKGRQAGVALCGEKNGSAKLTERNVRLIRQMHASGEHGPKGLSELFGVSAATIKKVVNRSKWQLVA